ncbi:MAG: Hsp70 family protein [Clostridia bacterium]|nr:Hsp70 family protein [Clostridia bacterium]
MRYVGLDIGDGESAVALLEENSIIEPVIQPIDGYSSVVSIVGMSGTEVRVGEKALLDRKVAHLRSRFKSRYLTSADAEKDIERFAYGLKRQLETEQPGFFGRDTYVTVGCPAGWKPADRERYAEVMRKAGFDQVHIVSESRAAFFYARYAHELNISPEMLSQTTLIIDIGSSTTDFAYIINGRESDIGTFGDVSLGGGLIEACMLRKAVRRSPEREQIEAVFEESVSWKNRCELTARRLKEQYFLSEDKWQATPCVATETIYYDEPVRLRFELNESIMRDIISTPLDELSGVTFQECLSDLLRHAGNATRENPPKLLILTGGASRMGFFREACAREFPQAQIVVCPEPEYSIAKGLAYAGRVDKQLEDFYSEIEAYFHGEEIGRLVASSLDWLTVPMASVLSGRIVNDVVLDALEQWKNGDIRTIEEMDRPIIEGASQLLTNLDAIEELKPVVNDWCRRLFLKLQPDIDEICRAHSIDRSSMSLSAVHSLASPDRMNIMLENRFFSTLTYVVTASLSAALCGGGSIALLAEGPIGWLAGAVIGLAVGFLGKKAVDGAVRRADMPGLARKLTAAGLRKSLGSARQRRTIEEELMRTMQKPEFVRQLTGDVTSSLEAQIVAMARSVEMPIVQ